MDFSEGEFINGFLSIPFSVSVFFCWIRRVTFAALSFFFVYAPKVVMVWWRSIGLAILAAAVPTVSLSTPGRPITLSTCPPPPPRRALETNPRHQSRDSQIKDGDEISTVLGLGKFDPARVRELESSRVTCHVLHPNLFPTNHIQGNLSAPPPSRLTPCLRLCIPNATFFAWIYKWNELSVQPHPYVEPVVTVCRGAEFPPAWQMRFIPVHASLES